MLGSKKLRALRRRRNLWKRKQREHVWYVFAYQAGTTYTWDHSRYKCQVCQKIAFLNPFRFDVEPMEHGA